MKTEELEDSIKNIIKPWGGFVQYTHNKKSTVKVITVKKGEILSLQAHNSRHELWVMLDHGLKVEIDDVIHNTKEGDGFFIKKGIKHRISAPLKTSRFLEISFGNFDENDIIRHEDVYNRS